MFESRPTEFGLKEPEASYFNALPTQPHKLRLVDNLRAELLRLLQL